VVLLEIVEYAPDDGDCEAGVLRAQLERETQGAVTDAGRFAAALCAAESDSGGDVTTSGDQEIVQFSLLVLKMEVRALMLP